MTDRSAAAATQTTLAVPVLRQGAGPRAAVSHLQHILNDFAVAHGDPPPFDESGVFGPKTRDAVEDFQEAHGLEDDGIVGKNTWKALLESWLSLEPPG
jgi:peptidoglycan hydrolase-like protein with peptidoglycan-binding domain